MPPVAQDGWWRHNKHTEYCQQAAGIKGAASVNQEVSWWINSIYRMRSSNFPCSVSQCLDWGALVFIRSTSASDPDWSCSCWWHISAAGTNSSKPGGLHWRRCHHECSRHCSRQSMFCSTPSNTQCASFDDTHHLVDTSACTCGDKGGLLQLSSLGYFRTTVTTAAVCL